MNQNLFVQHGDLLFRRIGDSTGSTMIDVRTAAPIHVIAVGSGGHQHVVCGANSTFDAATDIIDLPLAGIVYLIGNGAVGHEHRDLPLEAGRWSVHRQCEVRFGESEEVED